MKRLAIFSFLLLILSSFSAFSQAGESEDFAQAEREYRNGNYIVAYDDFSSFVKNYPLSDYVPDAKYRIAVCLYRLKRYRESLERLKEVEKRYRLTRYIDYVPFWKGLVLYELKDYKGAVYNLNKFVERLEYDSLVPKANLYLAMSHLYLGEYEKSERILKRLFETDNSEGDFPFIGVMLFDVLIKEKKYGEVIKDFSSLGEKLDLSKLPLEYKSRYYYYLAEAYWQRGEIPKARKLYEEMINFSPEISSVAIRRLFILAVRENNLSEMDSLTQLAEEKFAGNVEILKDFWLRIGVESYKRGNLELAEHFLKRVWKLRDKTAIGIAVPLYLAEIYIDKGDLDSAEAILKEFLANRFVLQPAPKVVGGISAVVMRLGDVYLMEKKYGDANRYYSLFLKKYPDSKRRGEAAYLVSYCLYMDGNFKGAISAADRVLEYGNDGKYYVYALKLKALALKNLGSYNEALSPLGEYLGYRKNDINAHLEMAKLSFLVKKYNTALKEVDLVLQKVRKAKEGPSVSPSAGIMALYIGGLASIAEKDYGKALNYLNKIDVKDLSKANLNTIYPFIVYYRGWAYYRLGDFERAASIFEFYSSKFPAGEFLSSALYMSGWCNFNLGNYSDAILFFDELSSSENRELAVKALFLKGKALRNLKKLKKAADVFKLIYEKYPGSEFADDALFDYGGILSDLGNINGAVSAYEKLINTYKNSPLLEETYYRRAEVYFSAGKYTEAKEAFYDYRTAFPKGKLFDAALYWGGYSAYMLKEYFGAVLLWEKLIADYPKSPFYADALSKTAEIYMKKGDYKKASSLYKRLLDEYPREAKILNVSDKLEELKFLMMGLSKREAELSAKIGALGGAKTKAGREAMVELARIYVMGEKKMDFAYEMLKEVVAKGDPETSAKAKYLIGEYFYRKGKLVNAGKEFLDAAFTDPNNRDLMAASIYRAAVMMKLARNYGDLRALVKRLEDSFPNTQWAVAGKRLLMGINQSGVNEQ